VTINFHLNQEQQKKIYSPSVIYDPKIWGGNRFGESIGELYLISNLKGYDNFSKNCSDSLRYLVKIIDTSDNLSIQVHPSEKGISKDECWLILDAKPGAGIYLGLDFDNKENLQVEDFFYEAQQQKDVSSYLKFFPVQKGDFFYIPAGALHAIGKDITLLEVQQVSGTTYRVWDWNRLDNEGKPRELHLHQAQEVTNVTQVFNNNLIAHYSNIIQSNCPAQSLLKHQDFTVSSILLEHEKCLKFKSGESFYIFGQEIIYYILEDLEVTFKGLGTLIVISNSH
jgi:mannose-6-phosphate isomerase class I